MRSGQARFTRFPGASSEDLLHYADATLKQQSFEVAIIHTGVNDTLCDSSSQQINLLLQNIKKIATICKSYKVKQVFISSIKFNTRISRKLLNEVNEMTERVCLENGYNYIKNGNVNENDLFKDGLHLQNSGKKISFACKLSMVRYFFRKSNMAPKYWSVRNAGVASATGKSNLQMLHEVTF